MYVLGVIIKIVGFGSTAIGVIMLLMATAGLFVDNKVFKALEELKKADEPYAHLILKPDYIIFFYKHNKTYASTCKGNTSIPRV